MSAKFLSKVATAGARWHTLIHPDRRVTGAQLATGRSGVIRWS